MFYIYQITNNLNGKTYIGQRKCPSTEIPETDKYMGSGTLIKAAIKKYGKKNFSKEILFAGIETKAEIDELEKLCIAIARENGKAEYNITEGGGGIEGYHHSPETKEKQSKAHKGKPGPNKGKTFTEEHRKKIGENRVAYWSDPENRQKQSDAKKGTHQSDETRKKRSDALKGKTFTKEHRQHLSDAMQGRICITDGERNKYIREDDPIPEGWRRGSIKEGKPSPLKGKPGHPQTPGSRQKMSKAKKGLIWVNNSKIRKLIPKGEPIPEGFVKGKKFKTI